MQNFVQSLLRIPGLLLAISVHEYSHARVAFSLGDDTAERQGRMTIEPWAHIDPMGALMLFLFGFGWARPVSVSTYRLRKPRRDMAIISLAGPVSNFVLAFVLEIITVLLFTKVRFAGSVWAYLPRILDEAAWINAGLGVFNLIPIPPLDGSKVLQAFLPSSAFGVWEFLERYGFVILVVLLVMGFLRLPLQTAVTGFMVQVQNLALRISLTVFP